MSRRCVDRCVGRRSSDHTHQWLPEHEGESKPHQAHSRHTAGTPKGSKKKQKLRSHTYHEGGQDHGWWVVTL